jgi:hypothetical protein
MIFLRGINMVKKFSHTLIGLALWAAFMVISVKSHALVITPTLDGATLLSALLAGGGTGIETGSATISASGHTGLNGATSAGTYTNASGTYGIGAGVILSSGDVRSYGDGPNLSSGKTTIFQSDATAAQQALLYPISGEKHYDVTQIDIGFDMLPGFDTLFFNITFGSEEYDEYKNSSFIDAFGIYINGVNIAIANGSPINIDHPDMEFLAGTELDGILGGSQGAFGLYVHTFSAPVNATGNQLTFIIADSGDYILDSTVYISQIGGSPPPPPSIPEPNSIALLGFGLLGLGFLVRRRRVSCETT